MSTGKDSFEWMFSRRTALKLLGAAGAGLLLPELIAACTSTASSNSQKTLNQLNWGWNAAITNIDPISTGWYLLAGCASLGGLLKFTPEGLMQPDLATSWAHPDPLTYKYTLRQGVKFWDGSPFTSNDVVYSYNRYKDPANGSGWLSFWNKVDTVSATGTFEVTITLKSPDPFFQYIPAGGAGRIISAAWGQAHQGSIGSQSSLVMSTGPYQVTQFVPNQTIVLTRNENFYGTKPPIKQINFSIITDDATRQLAMRSGSIDGSLNVPLGQISQWKAIPDVTVKVTDVPSTVFFAFDVQTPPWDDVHVRRAFSYAIDRAGLVHSALGGYGTPAASIIPDVQWGSLMSPSNVQQLYKSLPYTTFDLTMAKAEMAQSSHPNGFSASIQYPSTNPTAGLAAQALAQSVQQIGINLTVNEVTRAQWLNGLLQRPPQPLNVVAFGADYPDPAEQAEIFFPSTQTNANELNVAQYKNPQVDALISQQDTSTSNADRGTELANILKQVAGDVPYAPAFNQQGALAYNNKKVSYGDYAAWTQISNWIDQLSVV